MRLAKATRQNPRKLAEALVRLLPADPAVAKVDIAGAGFINFFLAKGRLSRRNRRSARGGAAVRPIASAVPGNRCRWNSYRRIRPGPCTSATAGMPPSAPPSPICSKRSATAWSASTTSTTPAAKWKFWRSAPGCATSSVAANASPFPRTAIAATISRPSASSCSPPQGETWRHTAAEVFKGLPPDEPQGGDKDVYIDALIARARALIGDAAFRSVLDLALDGILGDIREDLRRVRRHLRLLVLRTLLERRRFGRSARSMRSRRRDTPT